MRKQRDAVSTQPGALHDQEKAYRLKKSVKDEVRNIKQAYASKVLESFRMPRRAN